MTIRRYYHDAYTITFAARVIERLPAADGAGGLILDHTYFYPTSGGQPHDTGQINGRRVLDVYARPEDGAIVHVLDRPLEQDHVQAVIDWQRRFDHMQQHTGQHILSRAFIQIAGAETVGFHLGQENVTIDLNRADLTAAQVAAAEQLANEIIWQDRPVHVRIVPLEEAAAADLRKLPDQVGQDVRLVEIEAFDLTACGGTHVRRAGEIGLIKVLRQEQHRGLLRIHFLCGRWALQDYHAKNETLQELAASFTTGYEELGHVTQKLRDDLKQVQKQLREQQATLARYEAENLIHGGERHQDLTLVTRVFHDRDPAELRTLAAELTSRTAVVALLGLAGPRTHLVFARSADAPGDMNQLLRETLSQLGGKGGGTSHLAQGGGPAVSPERLRDILAAVRPQLLAPQPGG